MPFIIHVIECLHMLFLGMMFLMAACYIKEMTACETSGKTAMMFPLEVIPTRKK